MRVVAFGIAAIGVAGAFAFAACGNSTFLAGSEDASSADVQQGDARGISDGSTSDGSILEGAAPPGCHTTDSLCDDFDEAGTVGAWWGRDPSCQDPAIATDTAVSPPNALLASTDGLDASCSYLTYSFANNTHVLCSFDVMLDEASPDYMEYLTLAIAASSVTYYQVALGFITAIGSSPAQISEAVIFTDGGAANDGVPIAGSLVPTQWAHVALELDLAKSQATATIGTVVQSFALTYSPKAATLTKLDLRFGVAHANPANMRAHYDNVMCSASP